MNNYHISQSKVEAFLKICENATETLKDKKLAREALKKINDIPS